MSPQGKKSGCNKYRDQKLGKFGKKTYQPSVQQQPLDYGR